MLMFVKMEWTRHVLLNIAPNDNVNPREKTQTFNWKELCLVIKINNYHYLKYKIK